MSLLTLGDGSYRHLIIVNFALIFSDSLALGTENEGVEYGHSKRESHEDVACRLKANDVGEVAP